MSQDAHQHLKGFARAFIVPRRRRRWEEVLLSRSRKRWSKVSQLMDDLDPRFCHEVNEISSIPGSVTGMFFDFRKAPKFLTLSEAEEEARGQDAIFSIEPGLLAIHFSHEDWFWICERRAAV